jgi:nicotinate dehydrogenase subunit A
MTERFLLNLNGAESAIEADPDTPLLYALRNDLDLRGTRFGCGTAQCGACFVLIDGHPAPACDTPLWSVAGKRITTVEGLGPSGALHSAEAFRRAGAQCGLLYSGVLVARGAARENPSRLRRGVPRFDRNSAAAAHIAWYEQLRAAAEAQT